MGKEKGPKVFFEVFREQITKEESLPEQKPHPVPLETLENTKKVEVTAEAEGVELGGQELGGGRQGSTSLLSPSTQKMADLRPSQGGDKGGVGRRTPHEDAWQQRLGLKRDEVYVRQDTLIYAALGAVFLSLGCFFIGHKLGYDKGRGANLIDTEPIKQTVAKGKALQPVVKKTEEAQETAPVAVSQMPQTTPQSPLAKEDKWTIRVLSYKVGEQNTKRAEELARAIQREIGHDVFVAKTSQELVVCVGRFDNKDSFELLALQKELRDFKYENKKQFKGCYPVRLR